MFSIVIYKKEEVIKDESFRNSWIHILCRCGKKYSRNDIETTKIVL